MSSPHFKQMTSKYKSEFNAGVLEFDRLNFLLVNADKLCMDCITLNKGAILPYFAIVRQLYSFIRPFILFTVGMERQQQLDAKNELLWVKTMEYQNECVYDKNADFPIGLVKQIEVFHGDCLTLKQMLGFGLPLLKQESTKVILNRYLDASKPATDKQFSERITIGQESD